MLNLPNHQADPDFMVEAIEAQIQDLQTKMEDIEAGQRIKAQFIEVNELVKMTFQNMMNQYKLQIDFLEKIVKTIKA